MLTDAIEIMRFIKCPSCKKNTIDQYLIEQNKHEHKPNFGNLIDIKRDNQDGTITQENVQVHLYLTCGNCKFTIKIINKAWLKIFHSHAFGI